jgi:flagellar biosynthesis/type III secretory pathway protein FliH
MNTPPIPTRIDTTRADWKTIVAILNDVREQAYKDGYADGYNKGLSEANK